MIRYAGFPTAWVLLVAGLTFSSPHLSRAEITVTPERPAVGQLVRVRFSDDAKVGVLSLGDTPADVERMPGLLVFTAPRGRYYVIGFDGDAFIQKRVEFSASSPDDGGDDDDNDGGDVEPVVVDTYGFGRLAFDEARKIGDKAGAAVLSQIWNEAAGRVYHDKADIQQGVDYIRLQSMTRLQSWERWKPWARALEQRFVDKKLTDALGHVRAFSEVSKAMEVYSKT